MKCQIVSEWEHITQILLDDNGCGVKNKEGHYVVVDEYNNDFPKYTVQDAETGENLETFDDFSDAKAFAKEMEKRYGD